MDRTVWYKSALDGLNHFVKDWLHSIDHDFDNDLVETIAETNGS